MDCNPYAHAIRTSTSDETLRRGCVWMRIGRESVVNGPNPRTTENVVSQKVSQVSRLRLTRPPIREGTRVGLTGFEPATP